MDDGERPRTLLDGLSFPEGPRWRAGRLWFSDFYTHRVIRFDPADDTADAAETVVEIPSRPSGLGWMPDGSLLVVAMLDRQVMRFDGALRLHADLSEHAPAPCNDMAVDDLGRAWVGNFGFDRHRGEAPRNTCLIRVDADGAAVPVADDLAFPNGTIVTPDGATLIVAETMAHRLTAFTIAADGSLADRRVFAAFDDTVFPDGICMDAEGAVWIADPRGRRVLRVFEGGRIARTIALDGRGAYACVLGGPDRRTLFICTNTGSGPAMAGKRDGRIEAVRVDVTGAGVP